MSETFQLPSIPVVVEVVVPDAHFSSIEPPMIGEPIAAVPVVLTDADPLPAAGELPPPPPPHAASTAHMDAPSANTVIFILLILFLFTAWFLFRWLMKGVVRKDIGIQL
ncbi:hypothetical protein [Paraburkholderia saeva]|uniref:hypothetical protein n=1 Tax=Paraburkholderia saeva TaxID=2777537 RepID=UPI001E39D998|nr:hypothetical protein [Paraburkholderia saeva]